ncbi:MAG: 30S ribosomal protein S18 [Candidatus Obscuribacterales bacterium]|nr:30S ribosomal protein S18 [Candidatus Obscuribacterales bacterium]
MNKSCKFCQEQARRLDYKEPGDLRPFISAEGKILSRFQTGLCAEHQQAVAAAVKRARELGLITVGF